MVANSFAKDKRNPLQIAAFLNFSNIFLYLLTYNADSGKIDSFLQNTWHILAYRGHTRIMELLLNHIRYELKKKSLKNIDEIKKQQGFSNLDLVKGKLSKAVPLTDDKVSKFNRLQNYEIKEYKTNLVFCSGGKTYGEKIVIKINVLSEIDFCLKKIDEFKKCYDLIECKLDDEKILECLAENDFSFENTFSSLYC